MNERLTIEHLVPYLNYKLKIQTPDGIGKLVGIQNVMILPDRISVHFGKMVKTNNSIDDYEKTRNYGDYKLYPQTLIPISEKSVSDGGMSPIEIKGGCKPILRPLSDLKLFKKELKAIKFRTDEDGLYSMISDIKEGLGQWDLMKLCFQNHIDCFGLIPKNLAIDINTLTK